MTLKILCIIGLFSTAHTFSSIDPNIPFIVFNNAKTFSYTGRKDTNTVVINRQLAPSNAPVVGQVFLGANALPSAAAVTPTVVVSEQVYVCNKGRNSLSKFPTSTPSPTATEIFLQNLAAPSAISLSSSGAVSVVCNKDLNTVSIVVN